jgi:hypothetical protein
LDPFWLDPYVDAVGVGSRQGDESCEEPPAISEMRGTKGGSFKSRPATVIPQRGQVCDNHVCPSASDGCDVFQEHERRSKLADKADDLSVKATALSRQARTSACSTEVLAGKSSCDDVDWDTTEVLFAKSGNVVPNRCLAQLSVGHPRQEHATCIWLDVVNDFGELAVGDCSDPRFESKGDEANPGE